MTIYCLNEIPNGQLVTVNATKKDSKLTKLSMSKTQKINYTQAEETNLPELGGKLYWTYFELRIFLLSKVFRGK